jgi:methionyl-tRNA formyltransferase
MGCLNIHPSLLPRWRGAAPVQRAILAGDEETGVGIMIMEAGLDTGPVLLEQQTGILPEETAGALVDRLAVAGASLIVKALNEIEILVPRPQDPLKATYAAKLEKSEAPLDWRRQADELNRQVRAFNPFPGAETRLGDGVLKIWEAIPLDATGSPGMVIGSREGCPIVGCGRGSLVLTVIQRPGARRLPAAEFLKARPISQGTTLGI